MDKKQIIKDIIEINGYEKLNPPQEIASEFIGKNTIITTPTASGKTTIFEMYMIDTIINKKKKVVYISPLKALTSEHFYESKRKFSKKYNIKIGISTGDFDSSSKKLREYDILFLTYEKFDSILRHKADWLDDIELLTIDEIHELGSNRGATLEVIITQIKNSYKNIKILGLSATINNSKELSDWIDAKLVKSNYRPVPLKIGILYNNNLLFENEKIQLPENTNKNNKLEAIIKDTLNKNKQMIVFCNSRKSTMSLLKRYSRFIEADDKSNKISKQILEVLEQPTSQCLELYKGIRHKMAFHHAGLVSKQRKIIEDNFKDKNIKIIFATPTLAAGINLPAYRVLINTVFRFQDGGMAPISVNEFMQMVGRAGRPKYDKTGEGIALVNREDDIIKIYNSYINGELNDIESQLSKINILRMHLLSMIFINELNDFEKIFNYISKTFYYKIFGNIQSIKENIQDIVYEFIEAGFLEKIDNQLKITEIGEKICYLYIDPLSADNIIKDIEVKEKKEDIKDIDSLFTITNTFELAPYIRYKQDKEDMIFRFFEEIKDNIYFDYQDINLLSKVYMTKMLKEWISETPEEEIIKEYNTTPGQIRDIISRAQWIIYCIIEIAKIKKVNLKLVKEFRDINIRLKYGIEKDLISLVELKNIGRVRARRLYTKGIKKVGDIKQNPESFLSVVGKIGLETLKELKIEYQEKTLEKDKTENKTKNNVKKQKSIFDF